MTRHLEETCTCQENRAVDRMIDQRLCFHCQCHQIEERKKQMDLLWQQNAAMCIEVYAHMSHKDSTPLLLEQWNVEVLQG